MKLEPESVKKIVKHLKDKWGEKAQCPKCYKSSEYKFIDGETRVFMLQEYHEGTFTIGGDQVQIPIIPIFCSNCGYVDLLEVNIVNLIQKEKPVPEETPS